MSFRMLDQEYLLGNQYKDATKLRARLRLHERFSTNNYGWMPWVFDHLCSAAGGRVLELGCGAGALWAENIARVPDDWEVVLSDLSAGMVEETRCSLRDSPVNCWFLVADAQMVPFVDECFDVVVANHMLFHVPDIGRALSEASRILKPGGRLYATTNGRQHMKELSEMVRMFDSSIVFGPEEYSFGLENGAEQLAQWFDKTRRHSYEDSLMVTESGPLVAYILSSIGNVESVLVGRRRQELAAFVEELLATRGAIHITKDSGLFEACRATGP